jgi:phosphoglucomutase
MSIKFGTGGWRGIMGKEFTFHNLRLVVQAFSDFLKKKVKRDEIIIALDYDSRFFSNKYAEEATRLFTLNGIKVMFPERDTPLPALAYKIVKNNLDGGMIITASNNPPLYNGVKIFSDNGASLREKHVKELEKEIRKIESDFKFIHRYAVNELIQYRDFEEAYLNFLSSEIDIELIKKRNLKVVVDPLYGSAREYIDKFFISNELYVETIHNFRDPYFGGTLPIIKRENLSDLSKKILATKSDMGIAVDLDGDRFGIIDETGRYIHPNIILSLILNYLIEVKGMRGKIAKSIATTSLLRMIAKKNNIEIMETPVGAKYISELITDGKVEFGAEQSAGFWYKPHLNEKDGIFGGLLVAEMLSYYNKPLTQLISNLFHKYKRVYPLDKNLMINEKRVDKYNKFCDINFEEIEGKKVKKVIKIDGIKLIFNDDNWVLVRVSGNEPIIRFYSEGRNKKEAEILLSGILKVFNNV